VQFYGAEKREEKLLTRMEGTNNLIPWGMTIGKRVWKGDNQKPQGGSPPRGEKEAETQQEEEEKRDSRGPIWFK